MLGQPEDIGGIAPPRADLYFKSLLESLPAGAYTCDAHGLITYYNEQAVEVWGRAPKLNDESDRFCGSFRLYSSTGAPIRHEECWMALALKEERTFHGEEILVEQPDGGLLTALAYASPIHDEAGVLVGAVNVLVDITARKRSEEAAAHLAAIVASADDAVVSKDLTGAISTWNEGAERLFGYSREEAVGRSIRMLIPADRQDEEDEILKRIRRGERLDHYETVRRRKDGSLVDVSLTVSPIVDVAGRVVGASKIARDISRRKQAEDSLREQKQTLETINGVAAALAAELDLERLLQAVTDAATEICRAEFGAFFYNQVDDDGEVYSLYTLSGVPREAFSRFPMPRNTEVFGPTFRGESVVRSSDITADSRYGRNPPYHGMPEGHLPVRSYLALPVTSRSGEVLGGLFFGHSQPGVFTAQSEEILTALASHAAIAVDNARLYEEAKHLNESLEEEVERRTADLSNLNEELETFNYSIAHDLRSSLRGIDGFSQLIMDDCNDELSVEGLHYLERIRASARRMGQVLDDMLEMASLTRVRLRRHTVDLTELASGVVEALYELEPDRNVEVHVCNAMEVAGDPGLLRIALENLIGNAWKFTRQEEPGIIEVGCSEQDGETCYFVRDNGVGFDETYAAKLFEPFQRLHSPGQFEGSGIGLANVKRVIDRHGGRLWARSTLGGGSCFYFSLPDA